MPRRRGLKSKKENKVSMQRNRVEIVGFLTKKPEVHHTMEGTPVTEFSLGVNETFNGEKKQQISTFIECQLWGKSAESLAKFADKGEELFVEGALRQSKWKDRDTGRDRQKLFVRCDSWQFTQHLEKAPEQEVEQ